MEIDYYVIGRNIKQYRLQNGLKQAQLAQLVGVSAQHISHIECGYTKLGLPTLLKLAEALHTTAGRLLNGPIRPEKELAELLQHGTKEQQKLCIAICQVVMAAQL